MIGRKSYDHISFDSGVLKEIVKSVPFEWVFESPAKKNFISTKPYTLMVRDYHLLSFVFNTLSGIWDNKPVPIRIQRRNELF